MIAYWYENEIEDARNKVHNYSSDTFKMMLSGLTLDLAADEVKADITEITAGSGYTAGGQTLANVVITRVGGLWTFTSDPVVWTWSGTDSPQIRSAIIYNDTPTSPADPLVIGIQYNAIFIQPDGVPLTITPNATTGWGYRT